jgi:hypothetical protein
MKVLFIVTLYTLQQCFKKHGHYLRAKAQNLDGNLATISHNHYALLIVNNHFACCVVFYFFSFPPPKRILTLALSPQKKEKETPVVAHPLAG